MAPIVERIPDTEVIFGEGPHWDSKTQSLYFVDVFGKTINRYVPSTGQHTRAFLEQRPSIIIPVKGKENQFVGALEKEIVIIKWDGQSEKVTQIEKIVEAEPDTKNTLNDGKCDSKGRLWIGTLNPELLKKSEGLPKEASGTLISLDKKNILTHVTKIGCSNGLAWSKNYDRLYYVDTLKGTVDAFDFDIEEGTISNRTEIFTPSKHNINGGPDGMTIDEDGNIWVAICGGFSILKIDPRKQETLLQRIELPAKQVTSVAWGGENLNELYVTTGALAMDGDKLPPPINGAIYRVTNLNTKGLPSEDYIL